MVKGMSEGGVILTGVDGSDSATEAARRAAELAAGLGRTLVVLCGYEKERVERLPVAEEFEFSTSEEAAATAERVAHQLALEFEGLDVVPATRFGKPAEALLDEAHSRDASVIVVGNRRVQGVARVLGSIAVDVAHKAPCDVYVAHTHSRD